MFRLEVYMRFPKHEAKLLQPGAFCSRFVKNEAKPKGILPCFPSSRPGGRDPVELKKKAPPKSISDVNTKVAPFIQSVKKKAKKTSTCFPQLLTNGVLGIGVLENTLLFRIEGRAEAKTFLFF
ncbi:MAG: hypothetical protein IPK21_00550 [Haliscomenobacter sp.]|nr:hypothetical protein [Haliscomenobacter sp.]